MSFSKLALRSTCAFVALSVAATASAQSNLPPPDVKDAQAGPSEEATTQGEIIVTGSRIRRDPLSQESPIVFVDSEDLAKTGLNSVNDVLQRLPSAGGGTNSKFNNSGNLGNPPDGGGVGAGSAEIDLRYLGSKRVLVLVDGMRYVNGASASGIPGATDLNSIPESMIERIEVLQDGASAIYGSDAIAGVVNIITKRSQKGFAASAQIGSYLEEGDGFTQNYQLSWGNGDGPTQIVVGGNWVKAKGVRSGDRSISAYPTPYADSCLDGGCSSYPLNGRFGILLDPTMPFDEVTNPFQVLTLIGPAAGGIPTYPDDFKDFNTPDRFNFAPFNFIQTPLKRFGLFANLKQEFTNDVNFNAKLVWNKRDSANQAAPLPLGIGQAGGLGGLLDDITVDATNIYNPFGVTLDDSNMTSIRRRMIENGPRRYFQDVKTLYGVVGFDGRFGASHDWFWDINFSYGRNKAKQTMFGNINAQNLQRALGPDAECTGACVPFNIFGGQGSITQEMLDYIGFTQRDSSEQKQWDVTANISGNLTELPGGDLGVAAGVEFRDLKGRFDPDPIVAAGFGSDIPALPTKGGYDVKEAYLELNAPLLKGVTGADLLELNGAVRFSDYSTSGSTTTLKLLANWKPIRDLRLRASWAQGFRAPSIGELYGTRSRFDSAIDDPCSVNSAAPRNFTNDDDVRANCIAQGAPLGSTTAPDDQLPVITSGNENLQAEKSRSWILGGVFSPTGLPGLSIEGNWYKIKIDGAIQAFPARTTLYNCVLNNDPVACSKVTRAAGEVVAIDAVLANVAGIRTNGIDFNLGYRTGTTRAGKFAFNWNNSFLRNWDLVLPTSDGTETISREGTEVGSPSQAYPKWKSIGTIDWDLARVGATLTGRYISEVEENTGNKLDSRFYTDFQLRWMPVLMEREIGLALGVNNLFDVKAPACFTCDVNGFDPTTYDVPGRWFYARASFKM